MRCSVALAPARLFSSIWLPAITSRASGARALVGAFCTRLLSCSIAPLKSFMA
ncbi:Uncharacterised protein [Bordetella pertussis]|nr:Uncharacterised protein [Bordetella pertussis]